MDFPLLTVILVSKYEEALRRIEELKPRILITEYDIDGQKGLALVEQQQRYHDDESRISIVISRNSSDSVIAEAAEEQVDCFLLKPFSTDDFRKKLMAVVASKIRPSEYLVKIKEGRMALNVKDYEKAREAFNEAKKLHEKPSLACFYLGDSYRLLNELPPALAEFQEGLGYNPLHYKCLIGEFEIWVESKDYSKAYELIAPLIKNFPLVPKRLTQVFIVAVFSMKFENLVEYYEHYTKLDQRSPELIKIASAAFYTGGKWYVQRKDLKQALELFDKALTIASRDLSLLEQIINEYLKVGAAQEAMTILGKAQPSDVGTAAYNRLAFQIDQLVLPRGAIVEKARKLAFSGEASPDNYKVIVRIFAEEGRVPLAEAAIDKAVAAYPDLREVLYQILEQHHPTLRD